MTSPQFVSLVLLFMVATFWANFYVGSFDIQLGDSQLLPSEEEQQAYSRLFTIVMTAGVVVIPVIGALMDWLGYTVTSVLTITFGILWAVLLLYPSKDALIVSFLLYTCFRTSFYAFVFAYIADTLGFKYFGALSGVMFVAGGIAGILQYPLTLYAIGTCHLNTDTAMDQTCDRGKWSIVNTVMVLSLVSCLSFSYADWQRRKAAGFKPSGSADNMTAVVAGSGGSGKELPLLRLPPSGRRSYDRISPIVTGVVSLNSIRSDERISVCSFESADIAISPPGNQQQHSTDVNMSYTSIATDDSFFYD